ncbi:MAG: flagellin lysine-N-methylase [Lachnospiraceae bacterium]|nr:flagellin lysine-N-methylase [Lachnospiraceae bacterium]
MLYVFPDYYKEFVCLADACEDTCCAGWQIVVDEKSLNKYKKITGSFRNRLHKSIDWKEGTFKQSEDKRCAFLNKDNLCDMQLALGEKSLCKTCSRYPRHMEEFENVREITLSVSCPEVARILFNHKEPVELLTFEKEGEEEFEDFDPFLYFELTESRDAIRRILQNRSLPVDLRSGLVLGLAHDVQVRVNRQELFSCGEVLRKYQKQSAGEFVETKLKEVYADKENRYRDAVKYFSKLHRLELLHEDWEDHLRECEYLLYGKGAEHYAELHSKFKDWLVKNMPDAPVWWEQLLVYFIDTYFCGAVYDGRVYAKAKMAVGSLFYIYEMLLARWIKNAENLNIEDVIMMVYRYSREIEHSDLNLERMEHF